MSSFKIATTYKLPCRVLQLQTSQPVFRGVYLIVLYDQLTQLQNLQSQIAQIYV